MLSKKVIRHITFALMVVGALFSILAIAGNSWENITRDRSNHLGLWKICLLNIECRSREKTETLKAAQAFMTLGCLGYLFAFIFCALLHVKKNLTINLLGIILTVSAACLLIGLSVYTNQASTSEYTYGWSYIIGWFSVVLTLVAALFCYADHSGYESIK